MPMGQCLFELHAHTSETSGCGQVAGAQVARLYKDAGYQGLVTTDHFHKQYFDSLGERPWSEKVQCWLRGWQCTKEEGDRIGLRVYLGMEFRNTETDDDFLVYGLKPDFLLQNEDIFEIPLASAIDRFHAVGGTVIQAHPVRMRLAIVLGNGIFKDFGQKAMLDVLQHGKPIPQIPYLQSNRAFDDPQRLVFLRVCNLREPEKLDGIEVYNGNIHWAQDPKEINEILVRFPELARISASDFHEVCHLAQGGTYFAAMPEDEAQLAQWIRSRKMIGYKTMNNVEVCV